MFPILLDLSRIRVALVGNGEAALRRLRLLDEDDARNLAVYSTDPLPALAAAAGSRLRRALPTAAELAGVQQDDGVVIDVDNARVRCRRVHDLVRVVRGRDAGADIEELPDAGLGGEEPGHPGKERPIGPDRLDDSRISGDHRVAGRPVGGALSTGSLVETEAGASPTTRALAPSAALTWLGGTRYEAPTSTSSLNGAAGSE